MPTTSKRGKRSPELRILIKPAEQEIIARAARREGRSVASFVRWNIVRYAQDALGLPRGPVGEDEDGNGADGYKPSEYKADGR